MLLSPDEELLCLRQPTLAHTQLREGRHRRRSELRHVARVHVERALQGALRVLPTAPREEDVGMDRAARPVERRCLVLARELVNELAPLGRALPVAGARARSDQVAVRLREGVDVADAACRGRRHRLLEQSHPLIPTACAHLCAPEDAHREHLEIVRVGLPRDLQCPARVLCALLDGLGVACPLHCHPTLSGAEARLVHGSLGAREPAAGCGRPAGDEMLMRDPDGRAGRVVAAPGAGVTLDGTLARGDPSGHVAEEPERQTEPVERLGRLLVAEDGLERLPRGVPPSLVERALTVIGPVVSWVAAHRAIVGAELMALGILDKSSSRSAMSPSTSTSQRQGAFSLSARRRRGRRFEEERFGRAHDQGERCGPVHRSVR